MKNSKKWLNHTQKFSIRKLTVGTCSIVIGTLMLTMSNTSIVSADSAEVLSNGVEGNLVEHDKMEEIKDQTEHDTHISSEEAPQESDETLQNLEEQTDSSQTESDVLDEENTENTQYQDRTANEVKPEWQKDSEKGSDVIVVEENGVRYNQMQTVEENDNQGNIAVYSKIDATETEAGDVNVNITFVDKSEANSSRFGVMLNYHDPSQYVFVGYDKLGWFWEYKSSAESNWMTSGRKEMPQKDEVNELMISLTSSGQLNATVNNEKVFDTHNVPMNVMEALQGSKKVALRLGKFNNEHTVIQVKADNQEGVESVKSNDDATIDTKRIDDSQYDYDTIQSDTLSARLDKAFPRIRDYQFGDQSFNGQLISSNQVKINDHILTPEVNYNKVDDSTAVYTLRAKDDEKFVDATIKLQIKIVDNQLHYDVIEVTNHYEEVVPGQTVDNVAKLIQTIDIPGGYFVSVSSAEEGAKFSGARMSTNTHKNGDEHIDITRSMNTIDSRGYMYGFVHNQNTVASVWSNSQYHYGGGANDFTRLTVGTFDADGERFAGIKSSPFIYQKAYQDKVYDERTFILPSAKVVFSNDVNDDQVVDWQDGAIAYRDIMNNPKGHEYVPELVAYRVVMNFGSQA